MPEIFDDLSSNGDDPEWDALVAKVNGQQRTIRIITGGLILVGFAVIMEGRLIVKMTESVQQLAQILPQLQLVMTDYHTTKVTESPLGPIDETITPPEGSVVAEPFDPGEQEASEKVKEMLAKDGDVSTQLAEDF